MLKKKIIISISLLTILGICLFAFNKPSNKQTVKERVFGNVSKEAIKIPLVLPLQGKSSLQGESALRGARLAVEVINKDGGILGHPLELVVGDSRSEVGLTAEVTRDFVSKNYKLIIGGLNKEDSLEIIANSKDANVLYLSDGSPLTCTKEDSLKLNNHVWGFGVTPQMQTEPFLISLSDKFRQPEGDFNIFLFGNTTENQSSYLTEIAEGLEFKICGQDFIDTRVNDLFQRVSKIFESHPDLLLFTTIDPGTEKFLAHAHKLSLRSEMTVATLNSITQEMASKLGEITDGFWTTTMYSSEIESEANKKFVSRWKEFFKDNTLPTATSIKTYTAIQSIKEALLKAGDVDFTSLEKGLEDLEFKLPQGDVVMSASNHLLIQPLYLTQMDKGKFSKLELLGDASHPALEGCSFKPQQQDKKKQTTANSEDY